MVAEKRTHIITTVFDHPFLMLKNNGLTNLSENSVHNGIILDPSLVEGYCADLADAIFNEKLKIPYKFMIQTKYGGEIQPGVWNGMIGELIKRTADVAVAAITVTPKRSKVVDFSHPFMESGISLMIHKPMAERTVLR